MNKELIATELNSDLCELYVSLDSRHIEAFGNTPPSKFIGEARLKMGGIKSEHKIDYFEVFEDRFFNVWRKLANKEGPRSAKFIVAMGCPELKGLQVKLAPKIANELCYLTLHCPLEKIKKFKPSWLNLLVNRELKKLSSEEFANPAQIHAIWHLASQHGIEIKNVAVFPEPNIDPMVLGDEIKIKAYRFRHEVDIIIGDIFYLFNKENLEKTLKKSKRFTYQLAAAAGSSGYYKTFNKDIIKTIDKLSKGPQAFNLEIPYTILGGISIELKEDNIQNIPKGSSSLYLTIIREMLKFKEVNVDPSWISSKLISPISLESTGQMLDVLKKKGFIVPNPDNLDEPSLSKEIRSTLYRRCGEKFTDFHRSSIRAAASSYDIEPRARKFFKAKTFFINESAALSIRNILQALREKLSKLTVKINDKDHVYQLSMQFFPLTLPSPDYKSISTMISGRNDDKLDTWWNDFIRHLVKLFNYRHDPNWIIAKLLPKPSFKQVQKCMAFLEQQGIIKLNSTTHRYVKAKSYFYMPRQGADDIIGGSYPLMFDLMERLAPLIPLRNRDFSTMIFAANDDFFKNILIKEIENTFDLITKKQDKIKEAEQMYQFNIQLFPHTFY